MKSSSKGHLIGKVTLGWVWNAFKIWEGSIYSKYWSCLFFQLDLKTLPPTSFTVLYYNCIDPAVILSCGCKYPLNQSSSRNTSGIFTIPSNAPAVVFTDAFSHCSLVLIRFQMTSEPVRVQYDFSLLLNCCTRWLETCRVQESDHISRSPLLSISLPQPGFLLPVQGLN